MPWSTALRIIKAARLEPIGLQSLRFCGRVAYYDEFYALEHSDDERERMGRALAAKAVLFLQCHGLIVTGPTVRQAADDLCYLEQACMNQVHAMSTGAELHRSPGEIFELEVRQ